MSKIVRITESQLNDIIKRVIREQHSNSKPPLNETKGDIYKSEWTENDTILTWYCTRYVKDGDTRKLGLEDLKELANHIIGSTEFSLKQQMSNMRYLAGDVNALDSFSRLQERVYNQYNNMPEEELREICLHIIDNTPQSVYEKFVEIYKKNKGLSDEDKRVKTEKEKADMFKKQSEANRDADLRRAVGLKDMSRFKSLGPRPKE
jgi:hypothetical protein